MSDDALDFVDVALSQKRVGCRDPSPFPFLFLKMFFFVFFLFLPLLVSLFFILFS